MNQEMISVIESVSNERGLSKEQLYAAIEEALAAAAQTGANRDKSLRINIDRTSGEFTCYRCWDVVDDEEFESEEKQIPISKAGEQYADIEIGDVVETKIESPVFNGRIAAREAKKVIQQKLREAEGQQIVANYAELIGSVVRGVVRYIEPGGVTIDLGNGATVFIAQNGLIPADMFRAGDRAQCVLSDVREEGRPPYLFGTRTSKVFLEKLFASEVPEINQGHIRIIGSVRDPGVRAKIAVQSLDPKLDPIGSCVGIRGSRVQAVSNELSGERIDVVLWDENTVDFVVNAMAPAEVQSVVIDEETSSMDVIVAPDKLSQAIGKEGLNVRLASELTGCRLNVMDSAEAETKSIGETNRLIALFHQQLGVGEDVAKILVDEGIRSIEDIGYADVSTLEAIEEFDKTLAEELHSRANDFILEKLLGQKDKPEQRNLSEIVADASVIAELRRNGIESAGDFADLSVPDLLDIVPSLDESVAKEWIMRARQPILEGAETDQRPRRENSPAHSPAPHSPTQ
ncbi:MAG: transcription termination factor NusA [Gammaproteobacteria bacterium]|nr:transcription termination factor NusA [Gammaproteobacteria bacterium]